MFKIVINVVLARWEAGLGFSLLKIDNNIHYFGFFCCSSDDKFHYINAKCGIDFKLKKKHCLTHLTHHVLSISCLHDQIFKNLLKHLNKLYYTT